MTNAKDLTVQELSKLANELSMDEYAKMVSTGKIEKQEEVVEDTAESTDDPVEEIQPEVLAETVDETQPKKKGIEKRIDELTAEKYELKAKADKESAEKNEFQKQLEELRLEHQRLTTQIEQASNDKSLSNVIPQDEVAPDRNTFEDPDEYITAMAAYLARQEIKKVMDATSLQRQAQIEEARKVSQQKANEIQQLQVAQVHKEFQSKVERDKHEYPDFDDFVTNNDKLAIQPYVFSTIERSELAPHVLYHLAKNPEKVHELNLLEPIVAAMRIGEIHAEIKESRKPKITSAKPPIKPISNRQAPSSIKPEDMSVGEYAAYIREKEGMGGRVRII